MAIIKAINRNSTLARILHYILRGDKTRQDLICALNVDPTRALEEMTATKKRWHKTGGRLYKHFIQSFEIGSVTPQEANQIAWEFVQRVPMFQDFEVVFATHLDRDHIHTHFIVNSVSFRDGHKLRYAASELDTLKSISDQIIREHGLQIEEPDKTDNVTAWNQDLYQVLQNAHEGKRQSWVYDTATAVLGAMENSDSKDSFTSAMNDAGYGVLWRTHNVTFTAPNGRKIRASRLEELFKIPSILARYGDREQLQETLKNDLQRTAESIFRISLTSSDASPVHPVVSGKPIRIIVPTATTPEQQRVLDAVCYAYGSAMCQDPKHISEGLAKYGYQWLAESRTVITPEGQAFNFIPAEAGNAKHHAAFTFRKCGKRMRSSYVRRNHSVAADIQQAADKLHDCLGSNATLADVLAQSTKISAGVETDWNHPNRSRIHLQDGRHNLSDIMGAAKRPAAQMRNESSRARTTQTSREDTYTKHSAEPMQMETLLAAVRVAADQATSRDAFTNAMRDAGYALRWTRNGTLTFICPSGEHIRASRLEKRYHLPPIAAAYGFGPRTPTKGARPIAAQVVREAAAYAATTNEFTETMQAYGYDLQWNRNKTDATIITEGGQHIRLSSLIGQFGLPTGGVLDGIQCEKTSGFSGDGGIGSLREAADRAEASIHRGRANLADRRTDRADSDPDERDEELAAEAAVRERTHRETSRKRPRTAAKSAKQRGSDEVTPSRGGADAERTANARGSRDDAAER